MGGLIKVRGASVVGRAQGVGCAAESREKGVMALLSFAKSIEPFLCEQDIRSVYSQTIGCAGFLMVQFPEPGPRTMHFFVRHEPVFRHGVQIGEDPTC